LYSASWIAALAKPLSDAAKLALCDTIEAGSRASGALSPCERWSEDEITNTQRRVAFEQRVIPAIHRL